MGRVTVRRLSEDGSRRRQDVLAAEEPLEVRVGGKALDAVKLKTRFSPAAGGCRVAPETLMTFPGLLRERQRVFESTGGLHAAGLFTAGGSPLVVREDVGRHNAVDKATGWALLEDRVSLAGTAPMVSGRASFERWPASRCWPRCRRRRRWPWSWPRSRASHWSASFAAPA